MNNAIIRPNNLINSFEAYLQQAYAAPMLSATEEFELACKFHENGDRESAKQLVFSHIKFVAKIARGYLNVGLPLADLVQEGTVGLMKAVHNFNPHHGVRLASFALHWIKAEIHEYILKNWSLVKIATTKAQRKIFFNLHKFSKQTKFFSNDDIENIATFLNVKTEEVSTMVQRMSHKGDAYTEESTVTDILLEDHSSNHADCLEQSDWQESRAAGLTEAMTRLDERSQTIIKARWLNETKLSLKEIAKILGVSLVRVGQLEKQALLKLKNYLS